MAASCCSVSLATLIWSISEGTILPKRGSEHFVQAANPGGMVRVHLPQITYRASMDSRYRLISSKAVSSSSAVTSDIGVGEAGTECPGVISCVAGRLRGVPSSDDEEGISAIMRVVGLPISLDSLSCASLIL